MALEKGNSLTDRSLGSRAPSRLCTSAWRLLIL